jgi:hypothetical protein
LNVQLPLHPGPVNVGGSGGTAPLLVPAVWVHELGCGPEPKSALCALLPLGYEKLTVPPWAIVACVAVPPLTSHHRGQRGGAWRRVTGRERREHRNHGSQQGHQGQEQLSHGAFPNRRYCRTVNPSDDARRAFLPAAAMRSDAGS